MENTCKKARYLLTRWVINKKRCGHDVVNRDGVKCSIVPVWYDSCVFGSSVGDCLGVCFQQLLCIL